METGRTRRPLVPIGILMMVVGVVAGTVLAVVVANKAAPAFEAAFIRTPLTAPVQTTVPLLPGEWAIYVAEGSGGGITQAAAWSSSPHMLTTSDISVTAPDGRQVVIHDWTSNTQDTITRNGDSYVSELFFTAPVSGDYKVVVAGNDGTRLIVAPVLSDILRYISVGGVVGTLASGLLFVLGLVLLITGLVTGRRQPTPALAATWPAPAQPTAWPPQQQTAWAPPQQATQQQGPQPPESGQPPQYGQPAQAVAPAPAPAQPAQPDGPPPEQPVVPAPAPPPAAVLPPAGWYPDPMRQATWRYWDGQAWTSHTG